MSSRRFTCPSSPLWPDLAPVRSARQGPCSAPLSFPSSVVWRAALPYGNGRLTVAFLAHSLTSARPHLPWPCCHLPAISLTPSWRRELVPPQSDHGVRELTRANSTRARHRRGRCPELSARLLADSRPSLPFCYWTCLLEPSVCTRTTTSLAQIPFGIRLLLIQSWCYLSPGDPSLADKLLVPLCGGVCGEGCGDHVSGIGG